MLILIKFHPAHGLLVQIWAPEIKRPTIFANLVTRIFSSTAAAMTLQILVLGTITIGPEIKILYIAQLIKLGSRSYLFSEMYVSCNNLCWRSFAGQH